MVQGAAGAQPRLLLVHIAKTGGTALRRLLKKNPAIPAFDCIHNDTFLRFRDGRRSERRPLNRQVLGRYDVAVLMARHPLERFISCYRYFLAGGLNRRGQGHFPADQEIQRYLKAKAPTLASCARQLPEVAGQIPHMLPACHWLDQLPNPIADLVFTGRQERFNSDIQKFYQLLGLDDASCCPERVNVSICPSQEAPLDPLARRLIEQFYRNDYLRFGYEKSSLSPAQLIQYWDQPQPPLLLLERMERWRKLHPDWEYCRYDRSSAAALIGEAFGSALQEAFLDIRLPAMQADVFRIAVLKAKGGVWIDAATHCLQPLETWLDRRQPLLLLRRAHQQHPKISNGFIHAVDPGHPLLEAAWNRISVALLSRTGQKVYRDFGPGVLRDLLSQGDPMQLAGLSVVPEADLRTKLMIGSSSEALGSDQHWSKRQQIESLYLSGGSPSASQRSNDAS